MKHFFEEVFDEAGDFFEDIWDHLLQKEDDHKKKQVTVVMNGTSVSVRPAYLFAERVDKVLLMIIGSSIFISAFSSSFLGFTKLSDLLDILIFTLLGRIIMAVIGGSYFLIAFWKLNHLGEKHV